MDNKPEQSKFNLKVDGVFTNKCDSIFGSLDALEKKHGANEKVYQEDHSEEARKVLKPDPDFDDCIDSKQKTAFKSPSLPPRRGQPQNRGRGGGRGNLRRNYTPGYRSEPDKWQKYSLADVKDDDMSDRTNAATALGFLRQLEEQKKNDTGEDNEMDTGGKIVFNKPKRSVEAKEKTKEYKPKVGEESALGCGGNRLVMPEYQFGAKPDKQKRKKEKSKSSASDKVSLNFEFVDDAEDGEEEEEAEFVPKKEKSSSFKFTPKRKRGDDDADEG